MKSGTLSLTSPSQRILSEKLRYPCFSQVPAGSDCPLSCLYCICRFNSLIVTVLNSTGFQQVTGSDCPSYRPIIHQSLHLIGFYSSSLRKFASTGGLRLSSSMPILHKSLQFIDCYGPSLRRFSQVSGSDCPLTDLLYISRFILLVSTVLRFASLASIGLGLPSFMPILQLSLQFIDCYGLSFRRFSQVSGSDCPLFKVYRVNIAPYYLFTLKKLFITENYTKFVCLFDLFSPRLSISKDI